MRCDSFSLKRWGAALSLALIGATALALSLTGTTAPAADEIRGEEYFTNRPLVTQDGETVRFWDDLLRDKIVVITFIYTECPNICSLGTARLARVYDWLGERMGRDIFFYSITLDPENDTPEDLKTFAESFGVGEGWTFLTGTREDIDVIRDRLGERARDLTEHRSDFVIGNARTGVWRRSSAMGSLTVVLQSILELDPDWSAPAPAAVAPDDQQVYSVPEPGEALYNSVCASCHTIGEGVRFAPDLAAVTLRRDPDWLRRFLFEPVAMLEEGDPTAVALDAGYPGVRMPDLGLSEEDVNAVIAYLAAEDQKLVAAEESFAEEAVESQENAEHDHGGGQDHGGH